LLREEVLKAIKNLIWVDKNTKYCQSLQN
jgi:hypothetical protein